MNDLNGTALAALAAALAPYIAQHLGAASQGNPAAQAGGTFGNPQTGSAPNAGFVGQQQPQPQPGAAFGGQAQGGQPQGFGNPQGTQQPQGFGGTPQQPQGTQVTPDMIQTLITPLVQNEQIKQALTAQMQQMGIQNLPDARPDQLPELYQRFQQVQQQAQQAGLLGGNAGGAPSII